MSRRRMDQMDERLPSNCRHRCFPLHGIAGAPPIERTCLFAISAEKV
jgi:hypothetical protein